MLYERDDVADLAYRRLSATCEAAGLDLFRHSAPEQITGSGRVYVVLAQSSSGWARLANGLSTLGCTSGSLNG